MWFILVFLCAHWRQPPGDFRGAAPGPGRSSRAEEVREQSSAPSTPAAGWASGERAQSCCCGTKHRPRGGGQRRAAPVPRAALLSVGFPCRFINLWQNEPPDDSSLLEPVTLKPARIERFTEMGNLHCQLHNGTWLSTLSIWWILEINSVSSYLEGGKKSGYWTALGIFPWWSQEAFQFKKAQSKTDIPGISWREACLCLAHVLRMCSFPALISYSIVMIMARERPAEENLITQESIKESFQFIYTVFHKSWKYPPFWCDNTISPKFCVVLLWPSLYFFILVSLVFVSLALAHLKFCIKYQKKNTDILFSIIYLKITAI